MTRRAAAWTAALLLGGTLLLDLAYAAGCGDGLSPYADAYSEANALRAGERFARDGWAANCGLPDVSYGHRYPGQGITGPSGHVADDPVYHGYPPGSDWLAGVSIRLFGTDHVARYRLAPLALGVFASAVFLSALFRTVGAARGAFVYLACALAPMFTNMTHSLYYHGYALGLLLIELSILMRVLRRPEPVGVGWLSLVGLLGFAQGWLSFDYVFLVTFAAVPVAVLVGPEGAATDWKKVVALVMAAGLGFMVAHGLHFVQSVLYFGSLREAVAEYRFRSGKMYGVERTVWATRSRVSLTVYGLADYLWAYVRWRHLFSPVSVLLTGMTVAALVLSRASFRVGRRLRVEMRFAPGRRSLLGLAAALAVAASWLLAKPFHALHHLQFIGRHLFLFHFACGLVVATVTDLRVSRDPVGRPGARLGFETMAVGPTE